MEQHQQLLAQYLRLQRKLAVSCQAWNSGRVDRLADALKAVEQQLRSHQTAFAGAGGRMKLFAVAVLAATLGLPWSGAPSARAAFETPQFQPMAHPIVAANRAGHR